MGPDLQQLGKMGRGGSRGSNVFRHAFRVKILEFSRLIFEISTISPSPAAAAAVGGIFLKLGTVNVTTEYTISEK